MSRSRGRGTKPKPKSKLKQAKPQPFMMFQVFDGHPWMEVRWDSPAAPKALDGDGLVRELTRTIQRYIALAESDEVRVSGVPYAVAREQVNGTEPRTQDKPVYPY